MAEKKVGIIEHFFTHISVAAIKITNGELVVGDTIHVVGATTDFTQTIESMQIDKNSVQHVKAGDEVGIRMKNRVREHDVIYKITEEEKL